MRVTLAIIFSLFVSFCFSQQETQYSNYQMNNFMLNPAVAGSHYQSSAKVGFRSQWVNMDGSPKTIFAAIQGPVNHPGTSPRAKKKRPHHGVGANLLQDRAGAIRYTGASATYAFHIKLNKTLALSLGASFGMKQFRLDESLLQFVHTVDDPNYGTGVFSKIVPDANLGIWLYSDERFFLGASARQVLRSDIGDGVSAKYFDNNPSRLYNHFFITGGYLFDINQHVSFMPSVMVQVVKPAPVQVDLNGTFWIDHKVAVGFSYRHLDAVYLIFNYLLNGQWEFGYAFDLTLSGLTKYNRGTHELVVGIRWPRADNISCPSQYW